MSDIEMWAEIWGAYHNYQDGLFEPEFVYRRVLFVNDRAEWYDGFVDVIWKDKP